jgi:DNA-binding SARP family transcriptional activator
VSAPPRFGLLGPVTICTAASSVPVPARLDRAVLAHLLLAEGRPISVDSLIDAVWGPWPPKQARNALQVKISRLRALLGDDAASLTFSQGSYRLDVEPGEVDAHVFTSCVEEAAALTKRTEHEAARAVIDRAMLLWRGDPLSDLDDHPRLVASRLRLVDEWMTAHELLAEVTLASAGVLAGPMAQLRHLLTLDPLRSRPRLLLMQALEQGGRRAEALAVYDAGRRLIAEQTGLSPATELQQAFEALLESERRSSKARRSA